MDAVTIEESADGSLVAAAHGGRARFTSRAGGTSAAPYDSFNLGPWTGDDPSAVRANHRIAEAAASDQGTSRQLVLLRQVHGASVVVHRSGGEAPGVDAAPEADAHVTDRHDLVLAALAADCVPVAFLAPWGVGAAHAGWRGLDAGVLAATTHALAALTTDGDAADPAAITAVIGPCAGVCCYETGPEVHAALAGPDHVFARGRHLDLAAIAAGQLREAGVGEVRSAGHCTICDPRYFSHRASGAATGRQAGLVWRD